MQAVNEIVKPKSYENLEEWCPITVTQERSCGLPKQSSSIASIPFASSWLTKIRTIQFDLISGMAMAVILADGLGRIHFQSGVHFLVGSFATSLLLAIQAQNKK